MKILALEQVEIQNRTSRVVELENCTKQIKLWSEQNDFNDYGSKKEGPKLKKERPKSK